MVIGLGGILKCCNICCDFRKLRQPFPLFFLFVVFGLVSFSRWIFAPSPSGTYFFYHDLLGYFVFFLIFFVYLFVVKLL